MKDIISNTARKYDKGTTEVKNVFKQWLNYILLTILIVLTAFLSFAQIGFVDGFTDLFWINLAYVIVINITSLVLFIPQGEDNEKRNSKSYSKNLATWGGKTYFLEKNGKLINFNQFCKTKTDEIAETKRDDLLKRASIDRKYFDENLKALTKEELKKFDDIKLNKKQIFLILRAQKLIRVKPINPTIVLAGTNKGKQYDGLRTHAHYKTKAIPLKIISLIVYSILIASVVFVPTGAVGWSSIVTLALRIFGLATSTIMGFYLGIQQIRQENAYNKEKILFIDEYAESQGLTQKINECENLWQNNKPNAQINNNINNIDK